MINLQSNHNQLMTKKFSHTIDRSVYRYHEMHNTVLDILNILPYPEGESELWEPRGIFH